MPGFTHPPLATAPPTRIGRPLRRPAAAPAAVLLLVGCLTAAPARADVTFTHTATTHGLGGVMDADITMTSQVSGLKQRESSTTRFKSKVMRMFGGKGETTTVTRLDKELVWHLNLEKKEYWEITLAELRERLKKAQQEMARSRYQEDPNTEVTVSAKATGQSKVIGGWKCKEVIITVDIKGYDEEKKQPVNMRLKSDLWLSKEVPGQAEMREFGLAYAEKMGITPELARGMGAMMASFGASLEKMAAEMKKVEGYPVETTVTFGNQATPEQIEQMKKQQAEASSGEKSQEKEEPAAAEESSGGKSKAGGLLGRKLGLGKSKEEKKEEPKAAGPAISEDGFMEFYGMTMTLTQASTGSVEAGQFEVPADFKKKDTPKNASF